MKRRKFIAFVGSAAACPLVARAQQPKMPVIGFFHLTSLELTRELLAAFHRGLGDTGYIEGKNVAIEYRWAHGNNDLLPTLAAELVRRKVSVSGDSDDPDRLYAGRRPNPDWPCRQSQPTWRKCHWHQSHVGRSGRKAPRAVARIGACGQVNRLPPQPDQPRLCRERRERVAGLQRGLVQFASCS